MPTSNRGERSAWLFHGLRPEDAPVMAQRRAASADHKGGISGPAAREGFEELIQATPLPPAIRTEAGEVGGVAGWWCVPDAARSGVTLLFSHGGGYVLGSAAAFRGFAAQLAHRLNCRTFIPDYRRAPEHPFPAAFDDLRACYGGLAETGGTMLLAGDSAGGGLILALLSSLSEELPRAALPAGAAVMSPWTDLALAGETMRSRAEADPIFTRDALQALAQLYLQGADPRDPRASPLHARLDTLPPLRIDVGDDEILLDDAIRYAARARQAGTLVELHVWEGMSHVFQAAVGSVTAAGGSLDGIAAFLEGSILSGAGVGAALRGAE